MSFPTKKSGGGGLYANWVCPNPNYQVLTPNADQWYDVASITDALALEISVIEAGQQNDDEDDKTYAVRCVIDDQVFDELYPNGQLLTYAFWYKVLSSPYKEVYFAGGSGSETALLNQSGFLKKSVDFGEGTQPLIDRVLHCKTFVLQAKLKGTAGANQKFWARIGVVKFTSTPEDES
jgi:hypothetical protein